MSEHFLRPNSDPDDLFSGHFPDTYAPASSDAVDHASIERSVDGIVIKPNKLERLMTIVICAVQFLPKWPTTKRE